MARCYIALGSNLAEPLRQVEAAVEALSRLTASRLVAVSPWYGSKAVGPGSQPDYVNGVVALNTDLSPLELLAALQSIEDSQGRIRTQRWGARTLDLDLLLYGEQRIDLPMLTVPHPRMGERLFVLRPLLDIAPTLATPEGISYRSIAGALDDQGLWLVADRSSPTMHDTGLTAGLTTEPPAGDKS